MFEDIGVSHSDNINKTQHLDLVKEVCSTGNYEEYIDYLFSEYGKKGDKFNIQLFENSGGTLNRNTLTENLATREGKDLQSEFSHRRDLPLVLNEVNEAENTIDVSFQTIEKEEKINPTDDLPVVIYKDGNEVEEYRGEGYEIRAPATYKIEARIYIDKGLIAVSNQSGIREGDQTDIVEIIGALGRKTEQ